MHCTSVLIITVVQVVIIWALIDIFMFYDSVVGVDFLVDILLIFYTVHVSKTVITYCLAVVVTCM